MDWIPGIVNTICVWFDYLIYSISTACYVLFGAMTEMNVDSIGESFANLVSRLQTFLGLIMMFVIAFNLLKILVDPSKAGQSSGTLVKRIAITVVLLVSMNFIFNNIFGELQTALIESNTIEKIILGNDTSQTEGDAAYTGYKKYVGTGKFFAYQLFFAFVDVDNNASAKQIKDDIMAGNDASLYDVVGVINDDGVYYRFPIISGIAGILLCVMFVTFAIDVGVRAFTLMLLEVIAPIPIIAYIADEKMLKSFIKSYISTFIELFARIFIIYITLFLMQFCMKSILGTVAGGETTSSLFPNMGSDVGTFFRALLLVAVIFSLFMFAKKIPQLLKSIFGIQMDTGSIFKNTKSIFTGAVGLGVGTVGGLAAGITGGAGVLGTLGAIGKGAYGGATNGARSKDIKDFVSNQGKNNDASKKWANEIGEKGGVMRNALNVGAGKIDSAAGFFRGDKRHIAENQRAQEANKKAIEKNAERAKIHSDLRQKQQNILQAGETGYARANNTTKQDYLNSRTAVNKELYEQALKNYTSNSTDADARRNYESAEKTYRDSIKTAEQDYTKDVLQYINTNSDTDFEVSQALRDTSSFVSNNASEFGNAKVTDINSVETIINDSQPTLESIHEDRRSLEAEAVRLTKAAKDIGDTTTGQMKKEAQKNAEMTAAKLGHGPQQKK